MRAHTHTHTHTHTHRFLDRATKELEIRVVLYNANLNLFTSVRLTFTVSKAGHVERPYRLKADCLRVQQYIDSSGMCLAVLELCLLFQMGLRVNSIFNHAKSGVQPMCLVSPAKLSLPWENVSSFPFQMCLASPAKLSLPQTRARACSLPPPPPLHRPCLSQVSNSTGIDGCDRRRPSCSKWSILHSASMPPSAASSYSSRSPLPRRR